MRSTNNINTIDFDAEGTVFWVVYDPDTKETLVSVEFDSYKWKPITLCIGDNFGLSELDETARFSCYDDAESVAQDVARIRAEENPGEVINLEIHRVRLEMVEMIQDIDEAVGKVKRAGSSDEEEEDEEDDWDVTSGDGIEDEEDEGFESNRFDRPRELLERFADSSSNKPKKVKPSKKPKKGKRS